MIPKLIFVVNGIGNTSAFDKVKFLEEGNFYNIGDYLQVSRSG